MAESLRPKLFACLRAVYKSNDSKESDSSPFVTLMKSIADVWFRTVFCTVIPLKILLRVIDVFLVFGIEFLHKFGLSYLSKKEKFLINSIKTETKGHKLGASVDGLIIAGNLTKSKLLYKAEVFDIEPLIKKCLKKDSYKNLKRFNFLSNAVIIESRSSERMLSLKKCKSVLQSNSLNASKAVELISSFTSPIISRQVFNEATRCILSWDMQLSNSIFTLFDQNGDEELEKSVISIGISLLVSDSIDQKLILCFHIFDTDRSGFLSSSELSHLVIQIENTLDGRSTFYQNESESMMKILDSNNDSKISIEEFMRTVKSHRLFKPILYYIQLVESKEENKSLYIENEYTDIHSPLSVSMNHSEDDSASDNLVEQNILEAEVDYVAPSYATIALEQDNHIKDRSLEQDKLSQNSLLEHIEINNEFPKDADKKASDEIDLQHIDNESPQSLMDQKKQRRMQFKPTTGRSESSGAVNLRNEQDYSICKEHHVDFPEVQADAKERDCARLCNKQSCLIY